MEKDEFIEKLCKSRKKCSKNSGVTHFLQLIRVWKIATGKDMRIKVHKLPRTASWVNVSIIKKLSDLSLVTQRNLVTSCLVFLQMHKAKKTLRETFSEKMYEIVKNIRKKQNENPNERTQKQKDRWLTEKEIDEFWNFYLEQANEIFRKRGQLGKNYKIVRDTLILAIHLGKGVPPPRNDWATATFTKNKDSELENEEDTRVFRVKGRWYVAIYGKTKTSYGQSVIAIHKPLSTLLTKFYKKQGILGKRLFVSDRDRNYTNSTYGSHLRSLFRQRFGKDVGSSLLRSMYISNKYRGFSKLLREYEADSRMMLHSAAESQKTYLKNLD